MTKLFAACAATLALALGFVLGQVSPPALRFLARSRAAPPPCDDIAALLDQCDARIRALRTAREQAATERQCLAQERRICARWGDAAGAAQLERIAAVDARLAARADADGRELDELLPIAEQLRALPETNSASAPRPAWVDAARVRLRLAGLELPR